MSWLSGILGGDKKVWKKIRNAGYRTARGYLAGKLGLPVNTTAGTELTLEGLERLLTQLQTLRAKVPPHVQAELDQLITEFLKP